MSLPAAEPEIEVATGETLVAAIMVLLAEEPEPERLGRAMAILKAAHNHPGHFDHLLVARRLGILTAAAWGQLLPGRSAIVWPPRLVSGETEGTAERLLAAVDERLRAAAMPLVQAVLKPSSSEDARRLQRFGFEAAVELLYLFNDGSPTARPPHEKLLEFEPYQGDQRPRMAGLIEATYEATLDIPQLNGVRDMHDVLDGYEQTGARVPDRWYFVRSDGADVGCLLLAEHPDQAQWELVYMGLKPAARGRGWGEAMVEFAKQRVAQSQHGRLVLAVDAANEPALRIYAKAGFMQCDRRSLYLKTVGKG